MEIDPGVALVVTALVALVSLSLGLIPALVPWQRRLAATLRGDARVGADNIWTRRARAWLIGLEIAGSVALLVGCGLMIRTAASIQATHLGTDFQSVTRARVILRGSRYPNAAAYERFRVAVVEQLASRGLEASVSGWPPFIHYPTQTIEAEVGGAVMRTTRAGMVSKSPGYFSIAGIPIRRGRDFATTDGGTAEPVAIVSETLARELWPTGNAIGSRIRYVESRPSGAPAIPWRRVVGIVADARQTYQDQLLADLYVPTLQADPGRFISLLIKTNQLPALVTSTLRSAVTTLDPAAVTTEARPVMLEDTELARARFMRGLLALFAGLTALLSALGIYGVVAHSVRQREREVAIRVAIGATPGAIARLFLRESAWLLGAGIVAGSAAATGLAGVLENRFFSTAALDLPTIVAAAGFMGLVGVAATLEPVIRVARRSPVQTLHEA